MDPVVIVGNGEIAPVRLGGAEEKIEQGDRVGTARHGDQRWAGGNREGGEMSAEPFDQIHGGR